MSKRRALSVVNRHKIGDNLAYHVYTRSLAPSGRKAMISLLGRAARVMGWKCAPGRCEWHCISYQDVQGIRAHMLEQGASINTVNLLLAGVKGIAKTAFNLEMMEAETLMRIQSVKAVKGDVLRKGRSLSKAEVSSVVAACKYKGAGKRDARDLALFMVGCGAGLRCSEITSLKVGDVDLAKGSIRVLRAKGRKQREIFVSKQVVAALRVWIKSLPIDDGPLFKRILKGGNVGIQGMSSCGVSLLLKALQKRAGIKRFTAHDMRRTFITRLLESGVDINIVRQLAGHSDVATTARYDRRDDIVLQSASRKLNL